MAFGKKAGKMGKGAPQKATSAPKEGSKTKLDGKFGGLFGVTPKKPEPDMTPRTARGDKAVRAARMSRLKDVKI